MIEPTIEELKDLLRKVYSRLRSKDQGSSKCVDYDPAGSTYEFTEYDWSIRIREILDITYEPNGVN